MRPAPSKQEQLASLRRQAQFELDEIRYDNYTVLWEGVWTILTRTQVPEASSAAEDASTDAREHIKAYLSLEAQIEALTGDKAVAGRKLAERLSHIYVRTEGNYAVHQSQTAASGQNYVPETQVHVRATGPISATPLTPGDVVTRPPLKDQRTISPTGQPGKDNAEPR